MHVSEFQQKWRNPPAHVTERQAAQEHFNDLCRLFNMPTPNDHHAPDYTFERGVQKLTGGGGFADVWKRGAWAWEYKRPGEDLDKAYQQLKLYADALENPPLLIVSDLVRFRVFTNFTGTATVRTEFDVDALSDPAWVTYLRRVFREPLTLRPGVTKEEITKEAAARFGAIAAGIEARGVAPEIAAHALMQSLFGLFAEDVGILPAGLFSDLLRLGSKRPEAFQRQAAALFGAMNTGGEFGANEVAHVNGGLFSRIDVPTLTAGELAALHETALLDWGAIEPAIFGTLFERSLDPGKRSQLGAHYTGFPDIERVVEPVVMTPLRGRWDAVREEADAIKADWDAGKRGARAKFEAMLSGFKDELAAVRVLDPACGSGNFLYVTLAKLLDLEQAVSAYGALNGLPFSLPRVRPSQMLGLEINPTARELAQVAVWIGYLQWMIDHGYGWSEPVLEPLETIRLQDALLDLSDPENPKEAAWPAADFIIGNPPFLGRKELRAGLGDQYVTALFRAYRNRVRPTTNLCGYFIERARFEIEGGTTLRAGLLATENIRFQDSRGVLDRVKQSGDIFFAWSDQPWTLDGAAVRISIVGFDNGHEKERWLDGQRVVEINASLSTGTNIISAARLDENLGLAFMGLTLSGPFDIDAETARLMLSQPSNVNGKSNAQVVRPYRIGSDVTGRPRDRWVIDFGTDTSLEDASQFEAPFEYVRTHVKPVRELNNREGYREKWWIHAESRSGMRRALAPLDRYIVTVLVSRHHIMVWETAVTAPANRLIVFARQDDYFLGMLQSRPHELWAFRMGAKHGVGNDPTYNVTSCFETYPFPWPPSQEPWRDERVHAIATAARELDQHRNAWLNPAGASEADLKKRTLTNLYNERPSWLQHDHAALDRAVWAAYGWDDPDPAAVTEETILARLLALNLERSGTGA